MGAHELYVGVYSTSDDYGKKGCGCRVNLDNKVMTRDDCGKHHPSGAYIMDHELFDTIGQAKERKKHYVKLGFKCVSVKEYDRINNDWFRGEGGIFNLPNIAKKHGISIK